MFGGTLRSQSGPDSSNCDDPQIPHRRKYGKTACLAIWKGSSAGEIRIAVESVLIFRALRLKRRERLIANKIKAINDGLELTFVPLLSIQNLLHFCHIKRKILSIAIT
jgi:hypothetical protein